MSEQDGRAIEQMREVIGEIRDEAYENNDTDEYPCRTGVGRGMRRAAARMEEAVERMDADPGALLEECEDCEWSTVWEGGSAAEDPGVQHAKDTGHTVHTEVKDGE